MSAQVAIAKQVSSERVVHINEIPIGTQEEFICCACQKKLIPVKTEARGKDWHFRHPAGSDITKCRNTALHDYAVRVLSENFTIALSEKLKINYSVIGKETWLNNNEFRSDVTVKFENDELHFEVYVTHDNTEAKNKFYETNKIKCCTIDLSDKSLLDAPPEYIQDIILKMYYNKKLLGWQIAKEEIKQYQAPEKKWYEKPENIFSIIILAIIGYFTFFKKTKRR